MVIGRVPRNLTRLSGLNNQDLSRNSIISDSTTINDPHLWIDLFENYWIESMENPSFVYRIKFQFIDGITTGTPILTGARMNDSGIRDQLWNTILKTIKTIIQNQYGSLQLYQRASVILDIVRDYFYQYWLTSG